MAKRNRKREGGPSDGGSQSKKNKGSNDHVLLAAAVVECCPKARELTAAGLCDLSDKYKNFQHRLPMLALASTVDEASFNEGLKSLLCDLEDHRRSSQEEEGKGKQDTLLHAISPTTIADLSRGLVDRLIDTLVTLEEKVRMSCMNDPARDVNTGSGRCIELSRLGVLGEPLVKELKKKRRQKKSLIKAGIPIMEAMRVSPGIDGRPQVYTDEEREAGFKALDALGTVCDRFPFIQKYLDPAHVLSVQNVTAPAALATLFPSPRLNPNPVDPSDGNALGGLLSLNGDHVDARWGGDLIRSHYQDPAGLRGGPSPLPTGGPVNLRVISFCTTGAGTIMYH